jgi:hypothetical protein
MNVIAVVQIVAAIALLVGHLAVIVRNRFFPHVGPVI